MKKISVCLIIAASIYAVTVLLFAIGDVKAAPVYSGGGTVSVDLHSPATAIGDVTPVAGKFTTLWATTGYDGPIGGNTANAATFTYVAATGFDGPIGANTAAAANFTTVGATGQITSTLAGGTAPFVVASTTKCANLNVDSLDGSDWATPPAIGSGTPGAANFTTIGATGQFTSTLAPGTAPFVIASTTKVANLDVDKVDGADWAAPAAIGTGTPAAGTFTYVAATGFDGPIGSSTAAAANFTTVGATGQITSTVTTGTAPLVIASTTKCTNLNVDQLDGADWGSPAAIGGVAPNGAAFTTFSSTGQWTSTLSTGTAPMVIASTTKVSNLNVDKLDGQDFADPGAIGGGTPAAAAFTTVSATGQITSTLAGGTAPFVVASNTVNTNLNADLLDGGDWASPGTIGTGTPDAAQFTTCVTTTSASSSYIYTGIGQLAQADATPSCEIYSVYRCYGKDGLTITDIDDPLADYPRQLILIGALLNEIQTITLTDASVGETWTLTFDGQTTGNLDYDASAVEVQAALVALSNIGSDDVSVTGSAGGPYTCIFQGDLAEATAVDMTGVGTGDLSVGVVETVTGGGACSSIVQDNSVLHLTGNWTMTGGATLTLIWDNKKDIWVELTRSANA